jgi:ribonucleoside-triphosphate reductase
VRKSFYKHYKTGLTFLLDYTDDQIKGLGITDEMSIEDEKYKIEEKVYNYALKLTIKEVEQAAEGLYHNLNSLQSRSGNQLPFYM